MSNEGLQILGVPEKVVTLRSGTVTLTPVRMSQLQAFSAAIEPIASEIMDAIDGRTDLLGLISKNTDRLIDAADAATPLSRQDIEDMLPDDFLELTSTLILVNASFFARNLLPKIIARLAAVKEQVSKTEAQLSGKTASRR